MSTLNAALFIKSRRRCPAGPPESTSSSRPAPPWHRDIAGKEKWFNALRAAEFPTLRRAPQGHRALTGLTDATQRRYSDITPTTCVAFLDCSGRRCSALPELPNPLVCG